MPVNLQDRCKKEVHGCSWGLPLILGLHALTLTDNPKRGLISIVDEWMKDNHEEDKLYPCWRSLVYIVAEKAVGGEDAGAAKTIAESWKGIYVTAHIQFNHHNPPGFF